MLQRYAFFPKLPHFSEESLADWQKMRNFAPEFNHV